MNMTKIPAEYNLKLVSAVNPALRYEGGDFAAWQTEARAKLAELLCMHNLKKSADNKFNIEYEKRGEGYTEYRFTVSSEEGYYFPCVLRIPDGVPAPIPTIICLQGHSTGFHISLGNPIFAEDEKSINGGDRDFCVRAIKEGYAALAIEQRNFGECGGLATGGPDCHVSSMTAIINGRTTIGERALDTMVAIDALEQHFSQLDTENIVLMGNSGGGTATYYTACLDERIKAAMPSCAVCTYKASIAAMKHCVCNFIPNIATYFDMGDLAGLIAPRKLVVVNGKDDPIFPEAGVQESYEVIKNMYAAAGVPDNCALVTGNGAHRFYADDAWPVLHKMMGK